MLGAGVALLGGCAASQNTARAPSQPGATPRAAAHDATTSSKGLFAASKVPLSSKEDAQTEQALAQEATLPAILRVALRRNPELSEARERVRAARAGAPAASRLPKPQFEYQLWAQPLARPLALDEAGMHMFGLRQEFPAPGRLSAEGAAASAQADVVSAASLTREQDVGARVHRVYTEYYRADREYRIHLEHVGIAERSLDAARAAYVGGRGTQQDVLRLAVELSRLHTDIATIDGDRRAARALLNTLMARPAEAALGPPAALEPQVVEVSAQLLAQDLSARRPEIAAGKSAVRIRESELDAAQASARWPTFMLGVQYMLMSAESERHNYGVTVSMSLPWLNPRYGEEAHAAEGNLAAERSALSSAELTARYELYEAALRLRSAREAFVIIERDVLPRARQSYESAEAAYRGGQGDSLAMIDAMRSLLELRIERERSLARMHMALADVERAGGQPISIDRTREVVK